MIASEIARTKNRAARHLRAWPLVVGVVAGTCSCNSSSSGTPPSNDAATPQEETAPSLANTPNLILNPGAELGPGTDGSTVPTSVPDWTTTGDANVIEYGSSGGFPDVSDGGSDAAPPDEGTNFFAGGPNDPISTFTQQISLAAYATDIAKGNVTFTLDGWLGGYSSQGDDALVTVYFLDSASASVLGAAADGGESDDGGDAGLPPDVLASASIGPVTAAERNDNTGFLFQTTTGPVPTGTVAAEVQIVMTRYDGANNDGYADNLSLTLGGN